MDAPNIIRLVDDSAWLTQLGVAELFQTTKPNISMHLINIFKEAVLQEISVVKEHLTTAVDRMNYTTRFNEICAAGVDRNGV